MLEVKNIYSGYDDNDVVKDISFSAPPGEILAVTGPNGCGKTTLFKTLARLIPYNGSVALDGQEIASLPRKSLSRKIALLAQTSGVYFPYTVHDAAALGRYSHSVSFFKNLTREDEEITRRILTKLELWEIKDRLINELSGGQLQRVFLARTLIQDPDIILLDEPTNHLDLKHQVELLEYLSHWVKEKNRTVIAALHDLNLVHRYADQVILMREGRAVSKGIPGHVLSGDNLKATYGLDIKNYMIESLERWRKTE